MQYSLDPHAERVEIERLGALVSTYQVRGDGPIMARISQGSGRLDWMGGALVEHSQSPQSRRLGLRTGVSRHSMQGRDEQVRKDTDTCVRTDRYPAPVDSPSPFCNALACSQRRALIDGQQGTRLDATFSSLIRLPLPCVRAQEAPASFVF